MDRLININVKHLALIQLHRWFQFYERPCHPQTLQHQLSLLDDDILIESPSGLGISQGKDKYLERVKLAQGASNAHHLQRVNVAKHPDNSLCVEAEILHQMLLPDQILHSNTLEYKATLKPLKEGFPLFSDIKIALLHATPSIFQDAYMKNRAASLLHCWLYCIENGPSNLSVFKEIFADDFELYLSSGKVINDWQQFQHWLAENSSKIKQSGHFEKNFNLDVINDEACTLTVDFEWYGYTVDNQLMSAKTHHEWFVQSNPLERFARIKKMVVKQVQPFTLLETANDSSLV